MFRVQNSQHSKNLIFIFSITYYFWCSHFISLVSLITVNVHVGPEFYFIKISAKFTYYGVLSDRQPLDFISFTRSFTFTGHFAVVVRNFCDAIFCSSPQNLTWARERKNT